MHQSNTASPNITVSQSSDKIQQQLELFPLASKRQKAQISSIPGVCPKERNRYRVSVDGVILGNCLSVDEALRLAKGGEV